MKRIVCAALVVVLIVAVASPPVSAASGDVLADMWYFGAVTPIGQIIANALFYTEQDSGGQSSGGGAGRYNTGATTSTPIVDAATQTLNIPGGDSYNITNITNTTNKQTVTNYINNNNYTYSYYDYVYNVEVNNNTYYQITYAPTYVNIYYLDPAGGAVNNNYYIALPDGRNSSDLFAYQMNGLVVSYNLINYDMVYDSPNTLLLAHFDGDIKDSGYYNTDPYYGSGATYSYLDSGAFGKALYWAPGVSRSFRATFAEPVVDFTLEYRLYFTANTTTTNYTVNSMSFGLSLVENQFSSSGNAYAQIGYGKTAPSNFYYLPKGILGGNVDLTTYPSAVMSPGVWYHLALVRESGVLRLYLNGIKINTVTADTNTELQYMLFNPGTNFNCAFYIDELRVSKQAIYNANFTPSSAPYTTNRVLVLPEGEQENYTLAIRSEVAATSYRVGGVRPSEPTKGFVYIPVNDSNKMVDCQIYDGSDWLSVDGRIYVGGAWVALSSYVVIEGDLPDPDPDPGSSSSTPGGGDDGGGDWDFSGIVSAVQGFFSGILAVLSTVIEGVGSLAGFFLNLLDVLADLGTGFTSFLAAAMPFIPAELMAIISLGVVLMITLGVLKLLRG